MVAPLDRASSLAPLPQPPRSDRARSDQWNWPYWPIVPLYPYGQRRTLCREVVPETLWVLEQIQGIFYVTVPIRMTVIRLEAGGLLVYAPVAPTPECVALMRKLESRYGAVKAIILPTVSGIEHKVFIGPFARRFPQATVYTAGSQWSFPLDLPTSWLGFPLGRTQVLPENPADFPFIKEFDYASLGPLSLGIGPFEEVAFLHRSTGTLLLTDSIISIPLDPPEVVQIDPFPLLFHARDTVFDQVQDSPEARRKGWQRICLFGLYFRPSCLKVTGWGQSFREAARGRDRSRQNYFGLFPVQWQPNWVESFAALRGEGRLLAAPILQTLILSRDPLTVLDWADRVSRWRFQRIIPCHFDAPLAATPRQFRAAFTFLEQETTLLRGGWAGWRRKPLPEADLQVLRQFSKFLDESGIAPPAQTQAVQ